MLVSFLLRAASIWRPSLSYPPCTCRLRPTARLRPPSRSEGVSMVRVSWSGSGADGRAFPDPVNVDGKTLDLVVQGLLWDAQKRRRRLNVALLASQCVLDDRPLDVFQLPWQRRIRRAKPGLVDRLAIENTKHETISDIAKLPHVSGPRIG